MTARPAARVRADACPGALQTHAAADGALARVRVPGGLLTGDRLRALAAAARELGDGALELTSRGNVQLRGLADGAGTELGERLAAAGLLPSAPHERVRNVLASALTGRVGGHLDVRPWVRALDAGICADPALTALPGRYLATLDDGRGDVAGLGGDVGLLALPAAEVALTLAGTDSGLRVHPDHAVPVALAATRAFLDERAAQGGTAWRLGELDDGPRRVVERISSTGERHLVGVDRSRGPEAPRPGHGQRLGTTGGRHVAAVSPGGRRCDDGLVALVAVVPLGRLAAEQADLLAGLADEVQLTPWRSVVVPDLPDDSAAARLTDAGLVLDPGSAWSRVTACAGRPGCAKSLADVRADAARAVVGGTLPAGGARQHWAGCERRCGRPRGEVVDVVATGTGYRVGWS
ncbi:precorrin-3B synthase [Geodermatophilus africanus]|uniref:Precorrin-3B synthase n=1 Tax=Geodermatophilus africanus TaxID=1137993 RepID=A0A1H3GLB6_9ACTN|nr:precorrin-3B synthase [Geodermatophilus africanus]SDY03785.1 precorrin-3B synthase [Geodermatophilus africanus]